MSYGKFRNIAGADNLIDINEYLILHQQEHPYLDPVTNRIMAEEKFNLIDRNKDGRVDIGEFYDASYRNPQPVFFNNNPSLPVLSGVPPSMIDSFQPQIQFPRPTPMLGFDHNYRQFRNIAGADNQIDLNEYSANHQLESPYLDPYLNRKLAYEKFNLVDRNRDGRVDYSEFRDAKYRSPYPYGYAYNYYSH